MNDLSVTPERGEIKRDFSQKEISEVVDGLVDGSIQIEDVPSCAHSRLLTPLSLLRNEAKLGNQIEKYNRLNNIIWSLKLTLVQPDKSLMPQMIPSQDPKSTSVTITNQDFTYSDRYRDPYSHRKPEEVSLVSAIRNEEDYSDEATIKRLKDGINTARKYYENEEKHLKDMRDKEYKELYQTHKMQPTPSNINDAKRAEDQFELQLVDSRNKWSEKLNKLQENKQKEISEMESELSYYSKPRPKYDFLDFYTRRDDSSNTVETQPEEPSPPPKKSQSPKRKTQTLQPKKGQRLTTTSKK